MKFILTELGPDGGTVHIYEAPVDVAVEAMQKNVLEMTELAGQKRRASEEAAKKKRDAFLEKCQDVEKKLADGMAWADAADSVSARLHARLHLYVEARRLGAVPETAAWASQRGNWRKFKKVITSLPRK
jgi:hypothetical protein